MPLTLGFEKLFIGEGEQCLFIVSASQVNPTLLVGASPFVSCRRLVCALVRDAQLSCCTHLLPVLELACAVLPFAGLPACG